MQYFHKYVLYKFSLDLNMEPGYADLNVWLGKTNKNHGKVPFNHFNPLAKDVGQKLILLLTIVYWL